MTNSDIRGVSQLSIITALCLAAATAITIAGAIILIKPNQANATPKFTADTKLPCTQCHTSPPSAQNLTDIGKAFKDNGNKMPPK
jgi:hypothetical protein